MLGEEIIGKKIRQLRKARGLTLQDLAERAGISKGYLSKVETTRKAPPVATLVSIAQVLDITMGQLFGEEETLDKIHIVKKNQRKNVSRGKPDCGYTSECLVDKFPNKLINAFALTFPSDSKQSDSFAHKGEELMFILKGTFAFGYNGKEYLLEEGDCAYFDSGIPHYGRVMGEEDVQVLMAIPSDHLRRQAKPTRK